MDKVILQLDGTEVRSTQLMTKLHSFGGRWACFQTSATPQAKPPQLIVLSMRRRDTNNLK